MILLPQVTKTIGQSGSPMDTLHLTSALKNAKFCLVLTAQIFINLNTAFA